ncbi:MAG: SRPBCC domain-containing protein, partial [Gaiellaceae bacterium]
FKPTVRAVEANRELRWLGRLLLPGVIDGEHSLRIEPLDGGRTRFIQSERFTGLLVGLVGGTLAKTEVGFEQMNTALKARVEHASPQS